MVKISKWLVAVKCVCQKCLLNNSFFLSLSFSVQVGDGKSSVTSLNTLCWGVRVVIKSRTSRDSLLTHHPWYKYTHIYTCTITTCIAWKLVQLNGSPTLYKLLPSQLKYKLNLCWTRNIPTTMPCVFSSVPERSISHWHCWLWWPASRGWQPTVGGS